MDDSARPHTRIPRLASRLPVPVSTTTTTTTPSRSPSSARLKADRGLDLTRLRRPTEEIDVFKKSRGPGQEGINDERFHEASEPTPSSKVPVKPTVKTNSTSADGKTPARQYLHPRGVNTPAAPSKIATKQSGENVKKAPSRKPPARAKPPPTTHDKGHTGADTEKKPKSSSALRETIAKAKAAARKAEKKDVSCARPAAEEENFDGIEDPFNQRPKGGENTALLRSRLGTARNSGSLLLAAMGLKELPEEMLTMYDADSSGSSNWYEAVDLVKLVAPDNELSQLSDAIFPDINPEEQQFDGNSEERGGNQFAGLQVIDFRRNALHSLPVGFRRLQRLRSLNLSDNQLHMEDLSVIMEIESLSDLHLANNNLQGPFTLLPGHRLNALEVLDLRGNSLTHLPDETLAQLNCLRSLKVDENRLAVLPFQSLSQLPLRELSAAKNELMGTLIPPHVRVLRSLQDLNVASNALEGLSEDDDLEFPNLRTLAIGFNRITRIPDMSSWHELLNLSAAENGIRELPQGLVGLKKIKSVDLTGNSISKLDKRIGLMESLTVLRIANNPIRERKFLIMGTEEIKRDLKNRCEPEIQETVNEEDGSAAAMPEPVEVQSPKNGSWQVRPGGILDRSHTDMKEFDVEGLAPIILQNIRRLYLQRNSLRSLPVGALSLLASGLLDLDISRNPLDVAVSLTEPLSLPHLQTLSLAVTGLTSLDPITTNLSAPSLTFLDISCNRISGKLPALRQKYPKLATVLAADNRIEGLDFEVVRGLQVLDVSNNDINFLPPKIGLLRAEGVVENRGGGSALKKFEVTGNTFKVPRWQTVAKGTEAILEWLKNRIPEHEICELEP